MLSGFRAGVAAARGCAGRNAAGLEEVLVRRWEGVGSVIGDVSACECWYADIYKLKRQIEEQNNLAKGVVVLCRFWCN